ncbi:hypothetical protein [Streptomyces noursei]|uniref:Uncharacterized protein n=1 Tax=Streptomyces noursei TaxID=1971 RepID=A0A059W885_STRNR|nr:hypothetical protein [Streptomyces noursei]AIA07674.1 hypothetical protein DC74_7246 [Streptomyces noursei]UWS76045.1 hypothetical protein N1H47_35290 [Streptomyces noursei]GCB95408.1 hypothetical protein SALB_08212 [Streptomyces noursei]
MRTLTKAVCTVAGIAALCGSAPAFALTATTEGSKAYTTNSNLTANVEDTKADSRSAKGEYYRKAEPGVTKNLWNSSGSGTVVSSTGSSAVYQIRACRQEQAAPDTCGAWVA